MAKNRIAQVQELIKEELGGIMVREIEMPEGVVATITRVEATGNLQEARVYISVIPDEKRDVVFQILKRTIYDMQQELNKKLVMRPVPKIIWVAETATGQARRVEELLEQIHKQK